jgi:tRNA-dihydrouridine synthase C
MDGITDAVWRGLLTEIGSGASGVSLCVSEFVRVTAPVPAHVLVRDVPELASGGRTRTGVPVAVQLLGSAPTAMAETARTAAELGAPVVDLNFGCPAKTVNHHDGGATLLKAPYRVEQVVDAVRRAVPSDVPVSAKIRLGWDSSAHVEDIARAAEAGGAAWLTVHARTRVQQYAPPVDWAAIGRARAAVRIPVVANGDLVDVAAIEACAAASGCTAFMIGRGAMARPRLFRRLRGIVEPEIELRWFSTLLAEYVARLLAAGASERMALGRLKQWLRFAAPADPTLAELFAAAKGLAELADAMARVRELAARDYGSTRYASPSSIASPFLPLS